MNSIECINEKVDMSYSSYKAGNIPTSGGGCFKQLLKHCVPLFITKFAINSTVYLIFYYVIVFRVHLI